MLEDTIIAVSTPPGRGGLGIVRLSGKRALAIARTLFDPAEGKKKDTAPRRTVLGKIYDPEGGEPLDEVLMTYFKAPLSYTREDVVELSCHGSPVVLEEIVRLGVKAGARPAHPGEFTLRAYVNGRVDIIQAEAVNDLINAVTKTQARVSFGQLSGNLSARVLSLRQKIIRLAAALEAGIEFPDDGLPPDVAGHARDLRDLTAEVEGLAASYDAGRALRSGVILAIVGRKNVGKSTLFNALLGEPRAIVTPYPGTTRDFLREDLLIKDIVFHLVDMAGLGRAGNPAERAGMARSRGIASEADGLLLVLDASRPASSEDMKLLAGFRDRKFLLVANKSDLPARLDLGMVKESAGRSRIFRVSALEGANVERLRRGIHRTFAPKSGIRDEVVLHARQRDCLAGMAEALREAGRWIEAGSSDELCAEELRKALDLVGRLTGEVRADEVMAEIFGRFCVGK